MTIATPVELLQRTLWHYLQHPEEFEAAAARHRKMLPRDQCKNVEEVLATKSQSYREGLIIQLAYGLTSVAPLDLTMRHKGARGVTGVAGRLSSFLKANHISCTRDAYQNIGKNSVSLVRGNFDAWDKFLRWASSPKRSQEELEAAFQYACAAIAATSRPVKPMPALSLGSLTFVAASSLFEELFLTGSQGAYEQFSVAALLHAFLQQAGVPGYHVATKSLNASDRSSRVPGDVQILQGNRVVEAYEVTAGGWGLKAASAGKTMRDYDLPRFNIVADIADRAGMLAELAGTKEDIAVLDLRGFAAAILSSLTKQYRAAALERLYEFLDRHQPSVTLVNQYVDVLERRGLVSAEAKPK
jgi:hypothetical protein